MNGNQLKEFFDKKDKGATYINPFTGDKVELMKGYEEKYKSIKITKVNYALPNRSEIINATIKGIRSDKSLRAFGAVFIKVYYKDYMQRIGLTSYYIEVDLIYMDKEQE